MVLGQLRIEWNNDKSIKIYSWGNNKLITEIPVNYVDKKHERSYINPKGNLKTKNVFGIINCCSHGCFRSATNFDGSKEACYGGRCYANHSVFGTLRKPEGYNVIHNGINNNFFNLSLPTDENYDLSTCKLKMWRIASESSDGSIALASGLAQRWVKTNPNEKFIIISSDYFYVKADQLRELASFDNLVVGHTISTSFGKDDLENRFKEIERFQDYGVHTVVWIESHTPKTKKDAISQERLGRKVLKHVSPYQVIEVPFHHKRFHDDAYLHLNPVGFCCENMVCKGCKVLCGIRHLMIGDK